MMLAVSQIGYGHKVYNAWSMHVQKQVVNLWWIRDCKICK
jgi:hypothetical protein